MTLLNISGKMRWLSTLSVLIVLSSGCKKLVEVDSPYTSINADNVYATDPTAVSALTGIYTQMSAGDFTSAGIQSVSIFGGLSADEFYMYPGMTNIDFVNCYHNSQNAQTGLIDYWSAIYPLVYEANTAIAGLNSSNSLTPAVRQQLLGEAKFLRAFFYFYLVNFYGDVPLVLSTDYTQTSLVTRTPVNQVYQQMVQDLKDAMGLLNNNYVDATVITTTTERTRPNRWVAMALLSRVYLYTGDWQDAVSMADSVIGNTGLYSLDTDLSQVFLKNNNEAIWQWQPVSLGWNSLDARTFIIPSTGFDFGNPLALSSFLMAAFEPGDQRYTNWVDSVTLSGTKYYYPYKYKVIGIVTNVTEYEMVFRLAEQYLIRAEANAQLQNIGGALGDLNAIRTRAGLAAYSGAQDQASVLAAISHERQIELFTEWGNRWLDLKRTGQVNTVMGTVTPLKGGTWNADWALYPIYSTQMQRDPDLVQNPGY